MAHRKTGRRRGTRRSHSWINLRTELNSTLTAVAVRREVVLLLPATDADSVTLIRIVGSIFTGIQADAAANRVELVAWGIYIADSGTAGDLNLNPIIGLDVGHENWMMLKGDYYNTSVTNLVPARLEHNVDIRVSRKVPEGSGIKLVFNANVAYVSAAYLRGLVLHT